ncbi:FKBP-type peptidylprolyl isomerase [Psychromonas sp. CNPT3]|uniref:FKBP-type peptidyl-prolyl cis-trans isomerase n=1 Tax=Psychromonas sp. CNPT3 TaxID=314282 RepID=UPI00006E7633|nr:FKBP-type peptidyl-prolyl cis-trans isomerase [Psychromonas sp. CNPT3]AGH80323.1 FKBP-type peptidylprolyl isomerase [Psychromonas sp. CNPT3]
MKNVFKVSLLAACIALTVGCNDKDEAQAATDQAVSTESAANFATEQDKVAYAIGASFSRYVESTLEKQAEFGMTLDKEIIIDGISDTLRGNSKLTDEEMMATLKKYDETVKVAVTKKMEEDKVKSALEAKTFLDENAKVEGVTVTKSGLQYSVMTKADGPKPKLTDTVSVHYVGTLIDGTEFDSSIKRGQPAKFPLDRVIAGWTEGLQLMSVGEKMKFVIPADLAYGDQGAGTIPAGATLIFEVELLAIEAPAKTK